MADIHQNHPETLSKPSKLDLNILSATKALDNPTKASVAKHVVQLGGAKHIQTVYKRLKQKDYLQADIQSIEDFNRQQLVREDYPLARKRLKKALKDKDLTHKEALPYVKLAYDKMHGETHRHIAPQQVNIGNIERLQVAISQDLTD